MSVLGIGDQLLGLEIGATATSGPSLLPQEFRYQAAGRPNAGSQASTNDDLTSLYRRPTPAANPESQPIQTAPAPPAHSTSRYPMAPTAPEVPPLMPKSYEGPQDPSWSLKDRMRPDAGLINSNWLIDRGLSGAAGVYSAARYVPELSAKLPEGKSWPTLDSMSRITRDEWEKAIPSRVGKVVGVSWLADTALDLTLLSDKTTSWKTIAVDVALPLVSPFLIRGLGPVGAIALSVAGHSAEKYFLEDQR